MWVLVVRDDVVSIRDNRVFDNEQGCVMRENDEQRVAGDRFGAQCNINRHAGGM